MFIRHMQPNERATPGIHTTAFDDSVGTVVVLPPQQSFKRSGLSALAAFVKAADSYVLRLNA